MATVLTMCDENKAKRTHEIIYQIATELKKLQKTEEAELKVQKMLTKKLYVLAERYRILKRGSPGVSLYPEDIVERVACDIMCGMHEQIQGICESNQRIKVQLNYILSFYLKLDESVKEIDWTANAAMIQGDTIFQPLFVYVEMVVDWRKYFKQRCVEREVVQNMLNVHETSTIDGYLSMLNGSDEKDGFYSDMSFLELLHKKD